MLPAKNPTEAKQWPQYLVASSAVLAVFTTAFHTGWPAPSLPKLLSEEYPFEVSNEAASYITIVGHLGNMAGGVFGTTILDRIGRKKTITLIALPQFICFFLIAMSYYVMELLFVARFIGGVAEGMTFSIIPLYIAEIAQPRIRGVLGTFISLSCIAGMLAINLVGSVVSIRTAALVCLGFPLLFLAVFWKMPESPYYLLMKSREGEAETVLKFLRGRDMVGAELDVLVKDVGRQMSESGSYSDIFRIESNRKAFCLIIGARIVQQFTGVSAFSLYIQLLLAEATETLPPHLAASLLLLVQMSMTALSTVFIDKCGRKPLLLASAGGCCLNLAAQAIYFTLKDWIDLTGFDWFPLVSMILFVIMFSVGMGAVVNILSSEIFSASIKSKAVCLANVVFALGMMASTKFYQVTADAFGLAVPYWGFAICTLVGVVCLGLWMPETKGKSLEEIQQDLKGNRVKK